MHCCNAHLIHKSAEAAGYSPHEMVPSNKRQSPSMRHARTHVRVGQQPHAFERIQSVLRRVHIWIIAREPGPTAHCHTDGGVHVSAIVPPLLHVNNYADLKQRWSMHLNDKTHGNITHHLGALANIDHLLHKRITTQITRHTSYVTSHTSDVRRHTTHVTHHKSHITHHTSHVTRHTTQTNQTFTTASSSVATKKLPSALTPTSTLGCLRTSSCARVM